MEDRNRYFGEDGAEDDGLAEGTAAGLKNNRESDEK